MASTDITGPVARMKAIIEGISRIGLVWAHDIFNATDLRPMLVSSIAGEDTLRAWCISGPRMTGRSMVQLPGGWIERSWQYTIYGFEGLNADGSSLVTLRANALAICDAIDLDPDLAGTCHRSQPCAWDVIENRAAWLGVACSFVQITKTVVTLSTP